MTDAAGQPEAVVVLNDFSVARGGATTLALTLANALAEQGMPVTYFTGDSPEGPVGPGVDAIALNGSALLKRGALRAAGSGIHNHAAAARLSQWIAENDTPRTVYHVHGWSQILSPAIFGPLGRVRDRVVLHAHDYFLACPNGVYYDFRRRASCELVPMSPTCLARDCDKRSYPHKLFRLARQASLARSIGPLKGAARIVVLHDRMRPLLARAGYRELIHTVANPAMPFTPEPVRAEENRTFFYVGQLLPFKGVLELAEAASRARIALEVAGTGPEAERMRALCPEAKFHGWTARADLAALLGRARAIVVPSRGMESYAMVVAEAATSGIPVIISDSMNLAEEVTRRGLGLSFPAGDIGALAAALRLVDRDDALVEQMRRAAAARGWEITQTRDEWVAAIRAIYAEALAREAA